MKELSIEGKAKAYDEAIKRAREWYNELEPDSYTCIVESIFPELKESEDEKIRKWLISQLKIKSDDTNSELNIIIDKAISWLEKRGESNPYSGVSFKYNGHTWGMCARDNGVEILVDGEIKERVFLDSKPQGKSALEAIKEEKTDNANKVELKDYSSIDPHFGKPIDNVESKFKVGDWITNGATKPAQISSIEDGMYFTHNDTIGGDIESTNKEYHLWTIDDAKAGDVLATEDIVFIFKHMDKTGRSLCQSYCEVIGNSKLGLGFDFSINDVYPASKEQCELLHSKIKEAGYEWDAEKLELKKIKPEFWSDDDNKRFNGFKIELGEVQKADDFYNLPNAYHIFATEKQAKSALAMARISQIMANDVENFGGVITDEEWENTEKKFVICKGGKRICKMLTIHVNYFLTFHHAKQRDLFLKKYPQLVKDYLMIPEE